MGQVNDIIIFLVHNAPLRLVPTDLPIALLGGCAFLVVHASEDRIFPKPFSDTQNCFLPVALFGEIGFFEYSARDCVVDC